MKEDSGLALVCCAESKARDGGRFWSAMILREVSTGKYVSCADFHSEEGRGRSCVCGEEPNEAVPVVAPRTELRPQPESNVTTPHAELPRPNHQHQADVATSRSPSAVA